VGYPVIREGIRGQVFLPGSSDQRRHLVVPSPLGPPPRRSQSCLARRVSREREGIEENDINLNISRHITTALGEEEIDLAVTHRELVAIDEEIRKATAKHNKFLKELGLPPLP